MGTASTDSIKYIGKDYLELGIKNGMLLTEVNEVLFSHYTSSLKAQKEFNTQVNLLTDSSNIALNENVTKNNGKWSGVLDFSVQKGSIDTILNVDLSGFYDSIDDSVLSIVTEAYGTYSNGRTLIFSSDKKTFTQTASIDRFPIYGTSTVRVLEASGDVTYVANFTIGSSNVRNYAFDFIGQGLGTQSLKTQAEFNEFVLEKITQTNNLSDSSKNVELDGVIYSSWQQCCSALLGKCNNLQNQLNDINSGNNTLKTAANCGEQIKTTGCINC
jgi:hypothetical protein